jgi:hypothetical protein
MYRQFAISTVAAMLATEERSGPETGVRNTVIEDDARI